MQVEHLGATEVLHVDRRPAVRRDGDAPMALLRGGQPPRRAARGIHIPKIESAGDIGGVDESAPIRSRIRIPTVRDREQRRDRGWSGLRHRRRDDRTRIRDRPGRCRYGRREGVRTGRGTECAREERAAPRERRDTGPARHSFRSTCRPMVRGRNRVAVGSAPGTCCAARGEMAPSSSVRLSTKSCTPQ